MLTERQLWQEPIEFALRLDVEMMGGMKAVAMKLWPTHPNPRDAGIKLGHCLDEDRGEKLSLAETWVFLRFAREAGAFNGMTWLNRRCGYKAPELVDIAGEERRLQLEIAHGIEALNAQFEQMKGLASIKEDPGNRPASNVTEFRGATGSAK